MPSATSAIATASAGEIASPSTRPPASMPNSGVRNENTDSAEAG